jgi:Zn ribbon nucleic-acid-binding protein
MILFRPSMTPSRPSQPPEKNSNTAACKHPRVLIVAREEDAEFVECLECGEVFDSSEFKDMVIEESKLEEI